MRIPGPLCATQVDATWIDAGTAPRTRMPAPAERAAPRRAPRRTRARPLGAAERRLLAALDRAGITDLDERAMFLAQVAHESRDFQRLQESMAYSANRLLEVFPKKFRDVHEAELVVRGGPAAIAERLYGGRADLGNSQPGDGARYIGRGFIQLTGRANYAAAGAALGLDLVAHPELAADPEYAARIAIWFWQVRMIGPRARMGDVEAVTRRVNGGRVGLADRRLRFERYRALLRAEDARRSAPGDGAVPEPRMVLP